MLPHKLAVDAQENLYIIDRENKRVQVFDKDLNYMREIKNEGWNPWDIGISRKGTDGFAYIADHALERVHKMQLRDGKLVATWGSQGLRARPVRLGARHRRRLAGRRLRRRYLRAAAAEVRPRQLVALIEESGTPATRRRADSLGARLAVR